MLNSDVMALADDLLKEGVDLSEPVVVIDVENTVGVQEEVAADISLHHIDNQEENVRTFDPYESHIEHEDLEVCDSPKPRRRNPASWVRSKAKQRNLSGDSCGSKSSRLEVTGTCAPKCRRNCSSKVTLEQRRHVNGLFWSIMDHTRKWDFLLRHVKCNPVARRTTAYDETPRNFSYEYFFCIDGEFIQVCQVMFLKTLNISNMRIRLARKKLKKTSGVVSPDKRGTNNKKTVHPSVNASVVSHISSYPTYESHYTRRRSKKRYLDQRLNVRKMFRNYVAGRHNMSHTATQRQYEDVFRHEFKHKLSFFKPKKDQCGRCLVWKNKSEEEKAREDVKAAQDNHMNNKIKAREVKDADIEFAREHNQVCVATFDLQKVFFSPYGENGEFIFRRKHRAYNLSIFQSVAKIGYCYVWDETIAKKGASEVASCVFKFIETKVAEGYKDFRVMSDNCWCQNKNGPLFAMYNMASLKFNITIKHSYLEKGHTQMECDSIHSLIERRCKNETIFTPSDWYNRIRTAKVTLPRYVVCEMTQDIIYDFALVAKEQDVSKIPKSKVRQIIIQNNNAVFKKDFDGPEVQVCMVSRKRGRPMNWVSYAPPVKYSRRIFPKKEQLKDLVWLCDEGHIPEPHSQFYYALAGEANNRSTEGDDCCEVGSEIDEAEETDGDSGESSSSDSEDIPHVGD